MSDAVKDAARALSMLDLTSLGEEDCPDIVAALLQRAETPAGNVAAVCIWPRFVAQAKSALESTGIRVATVANFPHGRPDVAGAVETTHQCVRDGADEVDVVWPYEAWLSGNREIARDLVAACKEECGDRAHLKVILETGRLQTDDAIAGSARDAIAAGADFIKTSTGKTKISATLEAAHIMLDAIRESGKPVGLKPSGGIRTSAQAAAFLHLADKVMGPDWATPETFRFGASSLLDDLLAALDGER
ncbi:deoxyribose-phosphate aldolase [Nisaea acidiphila]|uniref:Deoxyribose-phosphate aldolase n=1 Tax=Nisaea acidiphila TaxID=1862145 RepID=A0A9J7ANU9_9PROT|nr:deoxyribose-phosphate aldolase [Nisaea acidiphila]UUX48273.1 deoxyribose-phosphate aldolase [Nisaea acidiphila]